MEDNPKKADPLVLKAHGNIARPAYIAGAKECSQG